MIAEEDILFFLLGKALKEKKNKTNPKYHPTTGMLSLQAEELKIMKCLKPCL